MLLLVGLVLVLIPAAAILYPFLRGTDAMSAPAPSSELARRWEVALEGLKTTELEWAIGNLAEDDYQWLRERYMTDAALVMKALDLEEQQEKDLLAGVEQEVREARRKILGDGAPDGAADAVSPEEGPVE